ncbi:hypothetical protein EG832_14305, partial [bacterium]|nr:hypothetical protein [bacterium]
MSRNKIDTRLDKFFSDFNPNEEADEIPSLDAGDTPVYAWETDSNGLITICDEGIHKVLGLSPDQAIGNPLISFQLAAREQSKFRTALQNEPFPLEIELSVLAANGKKHMVRYTIYHKLDEDGQIQGYRGYCELLAAAKKPKTASKQAHPKKVQTAPLGELSETSTKKNTRDLAPLEEDTSPLTPDDSAEPESSQKKSVKKRKTAFESDVIQQTRELSAWDAGMTKTLTLLQDSGEMDRGRTSLPINSKDLAGISLVKNHFDISSTVWTAQAQASFEDNKLVAIPSFNGKPAILATPLNLRDEKKGVIEIIDDKPDRVWTEEDRLFLQEISHQLGLALE